MIKMKNEEYYKAEIIDAIVEMYGYNAHKAKLIECELGQHCSNCIFSCSKNSKKHCLPPSCKREFFNNIYDSVLLQEENRKDVATILAFDLKADCPTVCYSIPCANCKFENRFCGVGAISNWMRSDIKNF